MYSMQGRQAQDMSAAAVCGHPDVRGHQEFDCERAVQPARHGHYDGLFLVTLIDPTLSKTLVWAVAHPRRDFCCAISKRG